MSTPVPARPKTAYPIRANRRDDPSPIELATAVAAVLEQHGYPTLHPNDLLRLSNTLDQFIYRQKGSH